MKIYLFCWILKSCNKFGNSCCKNQLIASIESAMVNMKVNIKAIDDKEYKIKKQNSILKIYQNLEYNKKKLQNF